jgi:ankyrin repeat protein
MLRKVGIHVGGKTPGEIMLLAASHGFINIIKFYECSMYPLHFQNPFGDSLLHYAAKGSQPLTVYYLLKRGLRPTIQNKFNETPLFAASESGHYETLHLIAKEKDCKIEHQDKFGDTALHFAARDGQLEACEYLIKKYKRLVKIKNQEGKTPLSYALDNAQSACAQCIKMNDGEATYADRQTKIKELAEKMILEFPDYRKSIFKHQQTKVTLFGKKISRKELEEEQKRLANLAELMKSGN